MKTPGHDELLPLLSAYVDGELTAPERQAVEARLAADPGAARLVEDLRASGALLRTALEQEADQVDWKALTSSVMSGLEPHRLPLLQRLRLELSELLTWHRGPMLAGALGAVAAVAIAIPLTLSLATPDGYGAARVRVQTVAVEEAAQVKPVVMETDDGDAVIWVVDAPADVPAVEPPAPSPGEAGQPSSPPGRTGEL
jgi:anti-sigma factor RsiW